MTSIRRLIVFATLTIVSIGCREGIDSPAGPSGARSPSAALTAGPLWVYSGAPQATITVLPPPPAGDYFSVDELTDDGYVAGRAQAFGGSPVTAWRWSSTTGFLPINTPAGTPDIGYEVGASADGQYFTGNVLGATLSSFRADAGGGASWISPNCSDTLPDCIWPAPVVDDRGGVFGSCFFAQVDPITGQPISPRGSFCRWNGGLQDLGKPGTVPYQAPGYVVAVGGAGHIVVQNDARDSSFVLDPSGHWSVLAPPPGTSRPFVTDVNNAGFSVGHPSVSMPNPIVPVLWDPTGQPTPLPIPQGSAWALAFSINDAGVVAGIADCGGTQFLCGRPVVWPNPNEVYVLNLPACPSTCNPFVYISDFAYGPSINNVNQVAFNVRWADPTLTFGVAVWDLTFGAGNRPPTAAIAAAAGVAGTPITLDGSGSSDPDNDPLTYDWDFGDGSSHGSGVLPTHLYTNPGTYTVTLVVSDPSNASGSVTTTVTISAVNQAPVSSPGGPYAGAEGTAVTFDGSGSSDPDNQPVTYDWDFGDGSPHGTGPAPSHSYLDNGLYTVTLTVNDGVLSTAASTTVQVTNVAPTATYQAPASVNQGTPFALTLQNGADASPTDLTAGLQYAFDCGTGTLGAASGTASTTCFQVVARSYTTRGQVLDKDNGATTYSRVVQVRNVAPTVTITNPGTSFTINVGQSFTVTGTFTDPGTQDNPWTARMTWGPNQFLSLGTVTPGGTISGTRVFTVPGKYEIGLEVRDKFGARGRRQVALTVR